jgi:hypothetical protein
MSSINGDVHVVSFGPLWPAIGWFFSPVVLYSTSTTLECLKTN